MGNSTSFADLYKTEWQGTWALWVVPVVFLAFLLISSRERDRRESTQVEEAFLGGWMLFWTLETLLDSLATGPLTRWLGLQGTDAATGIMLFFVLAGDLRVFQLVFRLARPNDGFALSLRRALKWMLLVPIFSWWMDQGMRQVWPDLPGQTLWLTYELAFLGLALYLRQGWLTVKASNCSAQRLRGLRHVLGFVAVYYALWAGADFLILVGGFDAGWLVRMVPNQLYYAFFVPFCWLVLVRSR